MLDSTKDYITANEDLEIVCMTGFNLEYWEDKLEMTCEALTLAWGVEQQMRLEVFAYLLEQTCKPRHQYSHLGHTDRVIKAIEMMGIEEWSEDKLFGKKCKATQARNATRRYRANKKANIV